MISQTHSREHTRISVPSDPPRPYRATHRVDTPGLPPLYCLREQDALEAAAERGGTSAIYLHGRHARTGVETWDFWRTWP
jgi:hypothetical protein